MTLLPHYKVLPEATSGNWGRPGSDGYSPVAPAHIQTNRHDNPVWDDKEKVDFDIQMESRHFGCRHDHVAFVLTGGNSLSLSDCVSWTFSSSSLSFF